ncbi:MAG: cytochrome c oxidase assembly protein [Pseudonocardiaceae bacterium]
MTGVATLPGWHPHLDAWFLLGALAFIYLRAVRRQAAFAPDGPGTTRGQKFRFLSGVGVLLIGSDWPIHDLAEHFLYSVHMTQHLLFTLVAGLLLVAGTPAWMAHKILAPRWLRSVIRVMARPVPALIQANVILVLSHWPLVVNATVRNHPLHFVAHAVLLVSAILMWLPVASPIPEVPRLKPPLQMLYLFGQTILPTVPASFLTFGTTPLYKVYTEFPRLWDVSVLSDQQMAGLIMKVGGGFYLWIVITVVFFKWCVREDQVEARLVYEEIEHELLT